VDIPDLVGRLERQVSAMPELKDIYEELGFISDRISTQVRTIALSVLALAWLFLAGGNSAPTLPAVMNRRWLLGIAATAIGVLVADYLQYLFGYLATNAVRKKAEAEGKKTAEYVYTDLRYRLRAFFYWFKQVLTILAAAWLGVALTRSLLA
jgi:hypothetical protein